MHKLAAVAFLVCLAVPRCSAQSGSHAASTSLIAAEAAQPASDSASVGSGAATSLAALTGDVKSDASADAPAGFDGPVQGSNEWQVWTGGGFPLKRAAREPRAQFWMAGGRYGRAITDAHGPSLLRGRFEWAFDLIPAMLIWTKPNAFDPPYRVYAFSVAPAVLKWDFVTRRRLSPYVEVSGGALFANHEVVPDESKFNFTAGSALGVSFPWGRAGKYFWTADFRWFHISDAGLTLHNPGLNTFGLRLQFGTFTRPKR